MKIKYLLSIILILILNNCASKIMQSYVGKDIRMAVLDYGPPSNAFDLGNGIRAFQWIQNKSYTTPTYISSNSYLNGYGNNFNNTYSRSAWINTNTVISGGQTINSSCVYTLLTKWDKNRKAWIITGYKQPNLMCE